MHFPWDLLIYSSRFFADEASSNDKPNSRSMQCRYDRKQECFWELEKQSKSGLRWEMLSFQGKTHYLGCSPLSPFIILCHFLVGWISKFFELLTVQAWFRGQGSSTQIHKDISKWHWCGWSQGCIPNCNGGYTGN